jgi:LIM domain
MKRAPVHLSTFGTWFSWSVRTIHVIEVHGISSYFFRICAGCHNEIGHGRFLSFMGAVWHPNCFKCHACHQPIFDYEVI